MKRKYILGAFSLLFLFSMLYFDKYIRRLFNTPKIVWTVQDSNSKLLPLLIGEDDFPSAWTWDLIVTNQSDQPSYASNLDEYARRKFVGVYGQHDIRVIHSLYQYDGYAALPDDNIDPRLDSIGVTSIKSSFPLANINLPNDKNPICYSGDDNYNARVTRCMTVINNEALQERIDVDIYGSVSKELIEKIVFAVYGLLKTIHSG